jgi:hypothetical protein
VSYREAMNMSVIERLALGATINRLHEEARARAEAEAG